MPANEIRLNCKVSEDMDPLLFLDLELRAARTRTRRLVQLAYLGLIYEKQSLGTGDMLQPAKSAPVAVSGTSQPDNVIHIPTNNGLIPPADFGDDMDNLFAEGGMSLNT